MRVQADIRTFRVGVQKDARGTSGVTSQWTFAVVGEMDHSELAALLIDGSEPGHGTHQRFTKEGTYLCT